MTVIENLGWTLVEAEPAEARMATTGSRARATAISLRTVLVLSDVLAVVAAWAFLRPTALASLPLGSVASGLAMSVAVCLGAMAVAGLYRSRVSSVRAVELARLPRVALLAAAAGIYVADALAGEAFSFVGAVVAAVVVTLALIVGRGCFDSYLRAARTRGRHCRTLVVIGGGREADELCEVLDEHPELGYRLAGRVPTADDDGDDPSRLACLGRLDAIVDIARETGANGVLLTAASMSEADKTPLVNRLLASGLHVHLSAGLRGLDPRRLRVVPIAHEPLFYVEPATLQPYQRWVKRAFDIVVASVVLVLVAPVLVASALAIKIHDGGPVLFRQTRVGRNGRHFTCLKLRTMRVGADAEQAALDNDRNGPLFKAAADPRVTGPGGFLRASSIDELPQLFNVLRGDMSLVGPRPAMPSEVEHFDPELLRRLDVLPGISGIWQVEARDVPSFGAYRRLDLYYVENWRFSLDVIVVVLTVQVVVSRMLRFIVGRGSELTLAPAPAES